MNIQRYMLILLLCVCVCVWVTGCQPYALRGRVIHGKVSSVDVVDANDTRLNGGVGVGDAYITFNLDPNSLGGEEIGLVNVTSDGRFEMPLDDVFGAGFLKYELGVVARAPEFNSAVDYLPMPPGNKRLLITLARGRDRYQPKRDPLKEIKPYLRDRNSE